MSPTLSRRGLLTGALTLGAGGAAYAFSVEARGYARLVTFSNWISTEVANRNSPLEEDHLQQVLDVFERIYSVQVDTIPIPFDQTLDRLLQYGNVGILPDVMQLTGNWPLALAGRGLLADLGPLADGLTNYRQDAFPGSFATSSLGPELYSVPFTVAPLGLWYHKKSLEHAGISDPATTIDELNDQLEILRNKKLSDDAMPIRVDFTGAEYSLTAFWPWIWSFGGNPLEYGEDESVALNWTDPGTFNAFQWAQDLIDKGYAPDTPTGWWDRARFAYGGVAYKVDGPYLRGHFSGLNPKLRTVESINDQ